MLNSGQDKIVSESDEIVKNKETCIIKARPGTGKTKTLRSIAETYPHYNFLYLSFSRDNVENVSCVLPDNCKSYNIHSLARESTKNKEIGIIKQYTTNDIARILRVVMKTASGVRKIMDEYYNSPEPILSKFIQKRKRRGVKIPEPMYLGMTAMIKKMIKREISLTHAFYLKEFSFNLQAGMTLKNIDCVLIDEYQDTSGVISSIYRSIPCAKIYVGDPDQAIFGFMGGIDSSFGIHFDREFSLDQNYRSGSRVISKANDILTDILGRDYLITQAVQDDKVSSCGRNAVICRTNASIIEYISVYENFRLLKTPDQIFELPLLVRSWIDGGRDFEKKYWFLRKMKTKKELLNHIKETSDTWLMSAYLIAIKYKGDRLYKLYEKAKKKNSKKARTTILSGHASKGLEFDKVRIGYDFPDLYELAKSVQMNIKTKSELEEEIRLYYVAVTRAKHKIIDSSPNEDMKDSEKFFIKNVLKML